MVSSIKNARAGMKKGPALSPGQLSALNLID
jgi:hypothetical protein